jgi:SAM-dependent methyltransferase
MGNRDVGSRLARDHAQLRPDSRLLGVGAGTELTSFFLTNHAAEVLATDIYADAEQWADVAPASFLAYPASFAPIPYDTRRLVPVHMDGRVLEFPDESFDGVFSSGSIEHFGSLHAVSNAAYEIGRVLKPGAAAAIATEFKLAGPPGDGWDPNVILFTTDTLRKHIVEASGLEPVDELDHQLSDATLAVRRDLVPFLEGIKGITNPAAKVGYYPNLVLMHGGYLFCSVHLTLRKTDSYPVTPNSWATPGPAVRTAVREARRRAAERLASVGGLGRSLLELLQIPANQLKIDALQREREALIEQRDAARCELDAATRQLAIARVELAELQRHVATVEAHLAAMQNSSSWQLTAPLRAAIIGSRRLFAGRR